MSHRASILALLSLAVVLCGCGQTVSPGTTDERNLLDARSKAAVSDFKRADPSLDSLLAHAHAYAIFPAVVTGAFGVGGAHGDGQVYKAGTLVGYADMSQVSIGAQIGGQRYSELILFENEISYVNFTNAQLEMDARATAIAASAGAGSTANYSRGVIVFYMADSGLMAQAAVAGQKFRFTPVLGAK